MDIEREYSRQFHVRVATVPWRGDHREKAEDATTMLVSDVSINGHTMKFAPGTGERTAGGARLIFTPWTEIELAGLSDESFAALDVDENAWMWGGKRAKFSLPVASIQFRTVGNEDYAPYI